MNWSKIKTALICLFLAIDLFLVCWDVMHLRGKSTVDDEVIENTVSLLRDRGIAVSKEAVDNKTPKIGTLTAKNPTADEAEFIGKILGKGYVKDGNRFYKEGKEVELSKSAFKITENIKIASVEDTKKWLEDNGIALSDVVQTEYMGSYIFRTFYMGYEVFGSKITVRTEGDSTVAEGTVLYVTEAEGAEKEILHSTSVLPRLVSDGAENCEIISITPGYMCISTSDEGFSEAVASPVYRIRLSDGSELFYDAIK